MTTTPPTHAPADAAEVRRIADAIQEQIDEGTLRFFLSDLARLRALAVEMEREEKERAERTVHCHDCGQPVRPMR